jgi:hypothetical protein
MPPDKKRSYCFLISVECSKVHRRVRRIIHFRGARVLPRHPSAMTSLDSEKSLPQRGPCIYRRQGRCGSPTRVPALAPRSGNAPSEAAFARVGTNCNCVLVIAMRQQHKCRHCGADYHRTPLFASSQIAPASCRAGPSLLRTNELNPD